MNILVLYCLLVPAGILAFLFLLNTDDKKNSSGSMDVTTLLAGENNEGFSKAIKVRPFTFPADHGPHPNFRNEWWYITGNLWDENNTRYGYQLTFFRRGLVPQSNNKENHAQNNAGWNDKNIYMAHFAISNHHTGEFIAREKLGRNGANVAGAIATPFHVWLDDWAIQSERDGSLFPLTLKAENSSLAIELTLDTDKPIVLQGNQGLSQKSAETGNASYYYSFTRLNTSGTLTQQPASTIEPNSSNKPATKQHTVHGSSWLDREWSSSALSREQQGWDWFALQLHSGEEVMFYRLRNKDGSASRFSSGVLVSADGHSIPLTAKSVTLTPIKYWQKGEHRFPIEWRIQIASNNLTRDWTISTPIKDQLLEVSVHYWEGAIDVVDSNSRAPSGYGFLEMTAY
ncbi:MAG: lipocalin-like domain-containing protein [Pseudomonadales bacterium]